MTEQGTVSRAMERRYIYGVPADAPWEPVISREKDVVRLRCGHVESEVNEYGDNPGSPRPCLSCWKANR